MKETQNVKEPAIEPGRDSSSDADTLSLALIFGGVSPEHEVSIQSAAKVTGGLAKVAERHPLAVRPIYISREGVWYFGRAADGRIPREGELVEAARWETSPDEYGAEGLPFSRALARMADDRVAAAIIMIHGIGGEDGRIQAALDLAGIAYTGSGAAASSLALDKPRCQAVLNAAGLPISPSALLREAGERSVRRVLEVVGLPCVVKPARGGSSVGVTIVRDAESLPRALEEALAIDDEIMAEKFVPGREFTCGVIERDDMELALPVTEIIPPEGRYFDYEAKYEPGLSHEITPAAIPDALAARIRQLALTAHRAIGCRGFSRTDFIADPGEPIILEVNTIPGMTATSLLPQGAAAMGIEFPALLELILNSASCDR